MKLNKIVFCTLRDNKGATGGPGGVLFLQKEVLGTSLGGVNCEYWFNAFEGGGMLKSVLNMLTFLVKSCAVRHAHFFTHDITSGWILAILGKQYSLVHHSQGPALEERINLGKKTNKWSSLFLCYRERIAFKGAKTLHFPSEGAAEMYFQSKYASCQRNEVNLQPPLYNIILPSKLNAPVNFEIKKDPTALTFFSLGTLTIAKGQDKSVEFLNKFLNYYTKDVRYIVVGKGPLRDELLRKLEVIKSQYSNFSYYYFESLPHDLVMYLHSISDVYLMLHRISIFDFATLEAMSQASAVVLSKVGGNPEFNYEDNIIFSDDALENMDSFSKKDFDVLKKKNREVFDRYFSQKAYRVQYEKFIANKLLK